MCDRKYLPIASVLKGNRIYKQHNSQNNGKQSAKNKVSNA